MWSGQINITYNIMNHATKHKLILVDKLEVHDVDDKDIMCSFLIFTLRN